MATQKPKLASARALDIVKKAFSSAKNFRGGKESKWNDFYQLYRAYLDESRYPWRANLFIPMCFWTIETIVSRIIGQTPKILVNPTIKENENGAKANETLIGWQWEQFDGNEKTENLVREGLKYGTSYLRIGWDDELKLPAFENVDILDLYVDPDATSLKDASFVIFRTFRTLEELEANENYDQNEVAKLRHAQSSDNEGRKAQRYAIQEMPDPSSQRPKENKKIEVLEYWTQSKLIVLGNQSALLRNDVNPHKSVKGKEWTKVPFVMFRDYPVAFEFYGIGEIEHLESLQNELNSLRNQIIDNNSLIVNRMFEKDPSSNVNVRNIISKPGIILPAGLKPVQTDPLPTSAFDLEQEIKADAQQTSQVTDVQLGGDTQESQMNKTASGMAMLQEAGNDRFRLKLKHLEATLKDAGEMLLARNQQYATQEQIIRVVEQNEVQYVGVKAAPGSYDVNPEAGSTQPVNQDIEREQTKDMIAQLANISQLSMGQVQVNWQELAKDLIEKYGRKNADDIIMEQQPMAGAMGQPGGVAPEMVQMLNKLGPDGTAQYIKTLPPEDQQIMNNQLRQLAAQGQQQPMLQQGAPNAGTI